jgi:histidinol-phosphatase (PHP family)
MPHHCEQIERLLEEIKLAGMALEINTSGILKRNEPFPRFATIIRAIKMGIPLLAGSDAHKPEDIGRFFDTLPEQLNTYS